jgi:hypothetical protein
MREKLTVILFLLTLSGAAQSPARDVHHNTQYWLGYMTSTMISDRYSWWNDFHLVPEGFAVVRTGLTRHLDKTSVTGGYAYLWLPAGADKTALTRHEHRPWAQLQFNLPVSGPYSFVHRIRYDARFRENVAHGEIRDGYAFNHRVRFLVSVRRTLGKPEGRKMSPYVALADEVLLNFGKEITTNTFDQNRISLSFGVQGKKTQYQLGIMNRFVQAGPARYTSNHTLVLWITQRFDVKKMLHNREHPESVSE